MRYFPRTEREKLIDVFAFTLLVAARRPRVALVFVEALAVRAPLLLELVFRVVVFELELDLLLGREVISNSLT